jgi:hypothetical protein
VILSQVSCLILCKLSQIIPEPFFVALLTFTARIMLFAIGHGRDLLAFFAKVINFRKRREVLAALIALSQDQIRLVRWV